MKVLVTGGAGFIGSYIVDALIDLGHEVFVVDNLSTGRMNNVNAKAKFYLQDVTDPGIVGLFIMLQPEIVYHQAAQVDVQVSLRRPDFDARTNILGTVNVLQAALQSGARKVIYASSAAAYGEPIRLGITEQHATLPLSFYGISKLTPEHYLRVFCHEYNLDYTILRYANVYGPRQNYQGEGGVVAIFANNLLQGEQPRIYGDGLQTRDFIFVKDVAAANLAVMDKGSREIFNIGVAQQISVNDLFAIMRGITGKEIAPLYLPPKQGEIRHSYFNISKAKEILGWQPAFTLQQGLVETILYYTKQAEQKPD